MNQPAGIIVNQTYELSSNGTISVFDDKGNSFGWFVSGLPDGNESTSLASNSTEAIQNITVISASNQKVASIEVTYSISYQSCSESGLRFAIRGGANWGPSQTGTIKIQFTKKPLSLNGTTAWFGNSQGINLGFNWSDSQSLSPVFSTSNESLSYTVGSNISIDPYVVMSASSGYLTEYSSQQKVVYANGRYWAFIFCGIVVNGICEYSSTNGASWTSPDQITTNVGNFGEFAVTNVGNTLYYVSDWGGSASEFYWRYGTLDANGSISWSISETTVSVSYINEHPTIYVDSSGNVYVSMTEAEPATYHDFVYKYNSSWNTVDDVNTGNTYAGSYTQILGSSAGIGLTYGAVGIGDTYEGPMYASFSTNGGTTWSSPVATSLNYSASASEADNVWEHSLHGCGI